MPIPVNVGSVQGGGFWDLASTQLQARQLQQQKQQQQQANLMAIVEAFMKQRQFQQEKGLEQQKIGILKQQGEQENIAKLLNLGLMPTTERYNEQELRGMPLDQLNQMIAPTGSFTGGQGMPLRPDTINIPGMGFVQKSPISNNLFQNLTISPEGEVALKFGDSYIPIKSLNKSGFSVKGDEPYIDQYRTDLQKTTSRMMSGENSKKVIDELLLKYPTMTADTLYNLKKEIAPMAMQKQRDIRTKAIQALKSAGYPTTERNIKSAMEQLRGQ